MPVDTIHKNINKLRAQGYGVDDNKNPVPDDIINLATQRYNPK